MSPPPASTKKRLVKPLPRFHPGKDKAGFQFIPVWPDSPRISNEPRVQGKDHFGVERDVQVAPSLKRPTLLKTVEPLYPDSARRAGLEGTVEVQIWVDENGKASKVDILKSDADIFNQPAIDAAMKFVFIPEHTISLLRHEFRFQLQKKK